MHTRLILFLFIFCCGTSMSQVKDSLQCYQFRAGDFSWKLELKKNDTAFFYPQNVNGISYVLSGTSLFTDSSYRFVTDTADYKCIALMSRDSSYHRYLLQLSAGFLFKRSGNYIIPGNFPLKSSRKNGIAKSPYGKYYYYGGSFWGIGIVFNKNHTYRAYTNNDHKNWEEKGKWKMLDNLVTLIPGPGSEQVMRYHAAENKMFFNSKFLIGREQDELIMQDGVPVLKQNYIYFIKQPD